MESLDIDLTTVCADCGTAVSPGEDRVYPFGTESVVCMECAVRRGGAYDEAKDRWTVPPRVDDLLLRSESRWA
jgi:hypothetical protein